MLYQIFPACFPRLSARRWAALIYFPFFIFRRSFISRFSFSAAHRKAEKKRPLRISRHFPFDRYYI